MEKLNLKNGLIERRMVEVDPATAAHYLTFNSYGKQRSVRLPHVDELAFKMTLGLFRFGEIAFVSIKGGRDLMMNGQHVCSAIIQSGSTEPCMLERFKTNSEMGASEIFRQFEILPRSLTDMVAVEIAARNLNWPLWVASSVVGAAVLERTQSSTGRIHRTRGMSVARVGSYLTKSEKVELIKDYTAEGDFVCSILTDGVGKKEVAHISKVPLVCAMIKTWNKDKADAKIFWQNVRDGEFLKKDDPEWKLRTFLLQAKEKGEGGYQIRTIQANEYVYRCLIAWNAFRQGKKTNLAYHVKSALPKLK